MVERRRSAARMLALAASAIGIIAVPVFGKPPAFTFRDDFAHHQAGGDGSPQWFAQTTGWSVRDGAYRCTDPNRSFALIEGAPHGRRVTVEATVRITGTTTDNWKVAGVAIRTDDQNYWHLALGESPDSDGARHFVELVEMLDGVWLAHAQPGTRLTATETFQSDQPWKGGEAYRLRLALAPEGIRGVVSDSAGREVARLGYRFDERAVTRGQPALDSGGFEAAFADVSARVEDEVTPPKVEFPAYRDAQGRKPLASAPGFFKVAERAGKWWFLDPGGREFFALGTDHANWNAHWCEKLGYASYHKNVVEKCGDEAHWAAATRQRLQSWGFNMLGVNSSPSLRHQGLPHVDILGMGQGFAASDFIVQQVHWTGFPDVFSDKWPAYCDKAARRLCAPQKDDPWLVGYFLDNELEWLGKTWREDGLAEEALKRPADHPAKQALIAMLRERHGKVEGFNAAWGAAFEDFEALAASTEPPRSQSDAAMRDKREFARLAAERYFREATRAIRKHDPNHLVLGCRFAGSAPDVWDIAGKYCDVVSVNTYRQVDLDTGEVIGFEKDLRDWYAKAQRPLMITEWSFPALDSGLPCKHGAGQRFDTQAQRAKAFEIFQTLLLRTPFMVGSDYFMWVDEPALGISSTFPEDSNYGLVNEHDAPYAELTQTATRVHARWRTLHEEGPAASPPAEAKPPAYKPGAPWAADVQERLPFLVWSAAPTEQPVPVAVKLRDLWPTGNADDLAQRVLSVVDEAGASVPFEVDRLPDGPQIALRLRPDPARAMFLYLAPRPIARELASPMLTVNDGNLRIHNGPLVLDKEQRSGAIFDRVDFDGTKVGSFAALLWQSDEAGNHWDSDNSAEVVAAAQGPLRVVADFITTRAGDDLGYRAAYRITAWKDEPWFSSRCLWIENTASKPWTLTAYYHYARSAFGAEAVVGGPDVPSYYLPFAVWTNPKLNLSYGALSPRLGDFNTYYWKDEHGGEHADFSQRLEVTLQPGRRFDAPQPEGIIFAARDPVREAAVAISRQVRAAQAIRFEGLPAERR